MRALPIGVRETLGALRHGLIGFLLNRLNQSALDFPILDITVCALLDKARSFVIDASECCWTLFSAWLNGRAALDTILQATATVASAHKWGLQSFGSFLFLKTRVERES
ncbi:hypothetical protein E1N52_13585 [Paraburkholderia guartelaensis]|uniref:Uncharacterized protein n=1 Tax=Paraburkholderia guartelaensis TaxID=2546446 RepID=A0A4R5LEC2_9BURK|nr:hypothetical protein [Paraburkholderia guartelaensis]TDG07811.1 hypothetical protein E1N52_13585 [Paraburkholderia guartelaensis]